MKIVSISLLLCLLSFEFFAQDVTIKSVIVAKGQMPNIAREWAQQLDKEGQPGTKLLSAYMEESRAAGVKMVRDWDKE